MALVRNPAHPQDVGPWFVATLNFVSGPANIHVRQTLLDKAPDLVSRALSAGGSGRAKFALLPDDQPMTGYVLVAPRRTTVANDGYLKVRAVRPGDRRAA